jgi:hypothetical protein
MESLGLGTTLSEYRGLVEPPLAMGQIALMESYYHFFVALNGIKRNLINKSVLLVEW